MDRNALRADLAARSVEKHFGPFFIAGGVLAVIGVVLFIFSLTGEDVMRGWQLFHVNWVFFTGLSAGCVAILSVYRICNAKWSGVVIRFVTAGVAFLPISLIGFLLIFGPGYHYIFPEMHGLFHTKEVWLSRGWMFWRLFIGLVALNLIAFALVRADIVPDLFETSGKVGGKRRGLFERIAAAAGYDGSGDIVVSHDLRVRRLAGVYTVLYAVVLTLIAFDMVMALQPHWYSNLLGGFFFMGAFLAAHMFFALMLIYARASFGLEGIISPKQQHDLGKLCFGFTVFWGYLMWAQYIVIWYGNLPEETGFLFARLYGPWLPIGKAVFLGVFVIPFIGLLGVMPKKLPVTMSLFALVSLVGLWLERYLLVLPSVTPHAGPVFGLPEFGATALYLGLFLVSYAFYAHTFPMISPGRAMTALDKEHHHVMSDFDHEEGAGDFATVVPD